MTRTVVLYHSRTYSTPRPGTPLALLAIARTIPAKTYRVVVVDASAERRPHRRVLREAGGALLLGITAMTGYQICDGLKLARRVRRHFPNVPIVWGGYHPSIMPRQTVLDPCVDFVVLGQGERPFAALVDELAGGSRCADGIPGVIGSDSEGPPPQHPESLDSFPFLAWDLVEPALPPLIREPGPAVEFYTSQGCPFACRFCAEPTMHGRRRVSMSAQRAVEEIEYLSRRGIRSFHLRDTLFFANLAWVEDFCREVLKRGLHVGFYGANGRVDTLLRFEKDHWRLLEKAGFREILLGVESGHEPALDIIDKRIQPEQSLELMERASHTKIKFFLTTMIGVPGVDPEAEFSDTVGLLRRLIAGNLNRVTTAYLFSYAPYPGSALYAEALSLGFRSPATLEEWGRVDFHAVDYPWGSRRRRRQARLINHYVLPRVVGAQPSRYRVLEAVYSALDRPLRRRWREANFDLFWEQAVFRFFGALRRLLKFTQRARTT